MSKQRETNQLKRLKMKKTILFTALSISSSMAIGHSLQDKNIIEQAGNIIAGSTVWNLDSNGIVGDTSSIDRLGESVSHGDYDNDGIQDLAIGIPNYDFSFFGTTLNNVGTVLIIYGSPNGLSSLNDQFLFQTFENDPPNFENLNGVEENDFFGKSLASGDFNCDGIDDLAVGTPEESFTINGELRQHVGAVNIFYGSDVGFADLGAGSTFLLQGTGDNLEQNDRFGWSMAAGDFKVDECDDLAVSAPFEDFGLSNSIIDGGQVEVFYGHSAGLSGESDFKDSIHQQNDDLGIETAAENGDQFGYSLAAGKFGINGLTTSLVVGIPGQDINNIARAGVVQVFRGGANGFGFLQFSSSIWSQAGDIIGIVEANDRFGTSVAVGDFNHDFRDDLVVGVPQEDINSANITDAGSINIIYAGTITGLSSNNNQSFHQDTNGIDGVAENFDRFGDVLAVGDLNDDLFDDIVVGVPRENNSKGAFHILYGGPDGITVVDSLLEKNLGDGEALDEMGYAMTIADFGIGSEIAVGIPGDDVSGNNDAGSVEVFSFIDDLIFANSFELNN